MKNSRYFLPAHLFALTLVFLFSHFAQAQKLSAEEIVAKHLEAIGDADSRKSLKNHVAVGVVQFTVLRQGNAGGDGKIVLASEGAKSLLGMNFNLQNYPSEKIIFDGKKYKVAYTINNARSPFGDYLYRYSDTIKEGLLGGTLSTAWALNDLKTRKAKLELNGTKKVNDREVYVLSYLPKGGSDLDITVFIDRENFQHLRTEYRRIISAMQGSAGSSTDMNRGATSADNSARQRQQKQVLIEEFSNYKKENGLNVPHFYRVYLQLDGASGTKEYEWKAEFSQFFINQPLEEGSFSVEGN